MVREKVEDSLVLDVLDFARKGNLREGARGTCRWAQGDQITDSVGWQIEDDGLRLIYTHTDRDGKKTHYSDWVLLDHTPATYGGERVWFACGCCEKLVRKLYLPSSGGHFMCRGCHHLSYTKRRKPRSGWEMVVEQMGKLEKELETPRLGSIRRMRALAEYQRLLEICRAMDCLEELPPFKEHRRPGRPSKRELRQEAQARREAARATMVKRPRGRPRLKRTYTRRTPLLMSERKGDMEGYCVKCRDRRELKDPQPVTLSNGRPAIQGTCPVCQTKVTRIVKATKGTPPGLISP